MIYDDLVHPRNKKIYSWMVIIWFASLVVHATSWSLLSLQQLRLLPDVVFFTEANNMVKSEHESHYATAYAEFMIIMLPYVLLATFCVTILILRRALVTLRLFEQAKQEPFLAFLMIVLLYLLSIFLYFPPEGFISNMEREVMLSAFGFIVVCAMQSVAILFTAIGALEALLNPHSERFIRFSNRSELQAHPIHSKYPLYSKKSRELRVVDKQQKCLDAYVRSN